MCAPEARAGCQPLCISLTLTHVSLDRAWKSGFSIKTKGRITNKIKPFLLHMTGHIPDAASAVTYDFSPESLCNLSADCDHYRYIPCA